MSAHICELIWNHSDQKGSTLLVLLAIGDNADTETAEAYPGIPYLARKTRLSERSVRYAVGKLRRSHELEILKRGGRKGDKRRSNLYRINVRRLQSLPKKVRHFGDPPLQGLPMDIGAPLQGLPEGDPNRQSSVFPTGNGLQGNRQGEPSEQQTPPIGPPLNGARSELTELLGALRSNREVVASTEVQSLARVAAERISGIEQQVKDLVEAATKETLDRVNELYASAPEDRRSRLDDAKWSTVERDIDEAQAAGDPERALDALSKWEELARAECGATTEEVVAA